MEPCWLCARAPKDVLCGKTTHSVGSMVCVNLVKVLQSLGKTYSVIFGGVRVALSLECLPAETDNSLQTSSLSTAAEHESTCDFNQWWITG